jgi:hypothetical protein
VNYIMPIYLEFAPEGIIGVKNASEASDEDDEA